MEYVLFTPLSSFLLFFAVFLYSCMKNKMDTEPPDDENELIKWYETKEKWDNMSMDDTPDEDVLNELIHRRIELDTFDGKIVMCYHYLDNIFLYWTDRKDSVSYNTLVNAAREYSVMVGIKSIFIEDKDGPTVEDNIQLKTNSVFMRNRTKPKQLHIKLNSFKYSGFLNECKTVQKEMVNDIEDVSWTKWKSKNL